MLGMGPRVRPKIEGDINWTFRRRTIHLTLIACALLAAYAIHKDAATTAAAFPPLSILAGGIIGSYVFGAAWERINGVDGSNTVTTSDVDPNKTVSATASITVEKNP